MAMHAVVLINPRRLNQLGWGVPIPPDPTIPGGFGGAFGGSSGGVTGGIGGAIGNSRQVVIRVTGTVSLANTVGGLTVASSAIQNTLNQTGWSVSQVVPQTGILAGIFGGSTPAFDIYASVESQYSDQDVYNNIRSSLASIMTISNISIVQGQAGYINANTGGAANNPANQSNDPFSSLLNFGTGVGAGAGAGALIGGLSVGTLLVGGLILFLFFKK